MKLLYAAKIREPWLLLLACSPLPQTLLPQHRQMLQSHGMPMVPPSIKRRQQHQRQSVAIVDSQQSTASMASSLLAKACSAKCYCVIRSNINAC
jgi:lysine/ornithine N-monooxygenase